MTIARLVTSVLLALVAAGCDHDPRAAVPLDVVALESDPCGPDAPAGHVGCPGNDCAHGACWVDGGWDLDVCAGEEIDESGTTTAPGQCCPSGFDCLTADDSGELQTPQLECLGADGNVHCPCRGPSRECVDPSTFCSPVTDVCVPAVPVGP